MKVESDKSEVTCEFCDTKFAIDDEVKKVEIDDAEKAGYDFERGRQKAKKEQKAKDKALKKEIAGNYKIQRKKAWIIGGILCTLLVVSIVFFALFNLSQPFFTKVSIAVMPETITSEDGSMTFYIEENKDFDAAKDDPSAAYTTYYYDQNDKKVVLPGGMYMTAEEFAESKRADKKGVTDDGTTVEDGVKTREGKGQAVLVGFFTEGLERAKTIRTVIDVIMALFIVCFLAFLIYLWYINWSIRQDKKQVLLDEAEEILSKKEDSEDE